jgi:hypothetical protein
LVADPSVPQVKLSLSGFDNDGVPPALAAPVYQVPSNATVVARTGTENRFAIITATNKFIFLFIFPYLQK